MYMYMYSPKHEYTIINSSFRRRSVRQRKSQKPRMVFATSFVNPNADHNQMETDWVINPLDSTDKSLLIVNELPSPGK